MIGKIIQEKRKNQNKTNFNESFIFLISFIEFCWSASFIFNWPAAYFFGCVLGLNTILVFYYQGVMINLRL